MVRLHAHKAPRGWTFPWYSSFGSSFNYDFGVSLDAAVREPTSNFRDRAAWEATGTDFELAGEWPGRSAFLRTAEGIFHTYSVYARGLEASGGAYYLLDETALGRQEEWEEPKGRVASARAAMPNFS